MFPPWELVDEYWDPVEPTPLSSNFAAVFPKGGKPPKLTCRTETDTQ